jgi:ABC-type bacteriocin/lantibiotic exporter with double-glycine peptidase domain
MALAYFGRETRLDEVREVMHVGRDGVSALNILRTARWYGLRGRALQIQDVDEEMQYLSGPTILHWEFNHFVVFERMTSDGVDLVDPALGRRHVTWEQFRKSFTGVALALEPTEALGRSKLGKSQLRSFVLRTLAGTGVVPRIVVTSILLQLFALAVPALTGIIVDRVVPKDDQHLLIVMSAGLGALVLFQFLASLIRAHLVLHLRTHVDSQMTFGFLEHLVDLPYAYFQNRPSGDLLNRVSSNANIREILTSTTTSSFIDGTLVVFYLLILGFANPQLALLVLGLGAVQLILFVIARRTQRDLIARSIETHVKSQSYLVQALNGIETLKSSGSEHRAVDEWGELYVDELNAAYENGRYGAWLDSALGALRIASPLAILLFGALLVMHGAMSLGQMLALSALANGFLTPLSTLVSSLTNWQLLGIYLDRINDVLETPREQSQPSSNRTPKLRGNIAIEQVSFRHGPLSPMVVRDVSLQIKSGRCVAIVGRSGAGKSTLARLLVGMYPPTDGRIIFDGVDLAQQDLRAVRAQIGVVVQNPTLFSSSIRRNIALAAPNLPLERVIEAARLSCIHDDILAMPMGYETLLADGGSSLSGGERQRLALARALVTRPSILLLDEATSALDAVTESRVRESLEGLGCTRIIIAHRLSTMAKADLIVVMDDGAVVEQGTHDELLKKGGKYAELISAQLRKDEHRVTGFYDVVQIEDE